MFLTESTKGYAGAGVDLFDQVILLLTQENQQNLYAWIGRELIKQSLMKLKKVKIILIGILLIK